MHDTRQDVPTPRSHMHIVYWIDKLIRHDTRLNPLGPIAPKVALLTSYGFVASLFQTKFAHELVFLLVVC